MYQVLQVKFFDRNSSYCSKSYDGNMLINYFEKGGKVTVPTCDGNMLINYFEKGGKVTVTTFVSLYTEFVGTS